MKRLISLVSAFCLVFSLSTCARFREPEPDYLAMMVKAAREADVESGRMAERLHREQLEKNGEEGEEIFFDQLYLLGRYIHFKYGNYRYSDELRLCAGEVVLNRMASPEYPDTMAGVIYQQGINEELDRASFALCTCPSEASVKAALRLLQGERMLEPEVVLETHYPAENIYAMFCDDLLGNTYFYKSESLELRDGEPP